MIISLGSDCVVKKRLEEIIWNNNTQISNIFDWVLSDLNAICHILESFHYNPSSPFFIPDKLSIITKTIENKYAVKHNDCYFISLHDASCDLSYSDAKLLICDKYNRRLKRFIDLISDVQNQISFVALYDKYNPIQNGVMKIDDTIIFRFFTILSKFNPLNTHKILLLTDDTSNLINSFKYIHRITIINVKQYIILNDFVSDWYRFFLDWNKMFSDLHLI